MDWKSKTICDNWKFILKDEPEAYHKGFSDQTWDTVTLPHDWSVHYPFSREYSSGTGYVRGGTAWYRKHFTLPDELHGKKIFLRFDGVYKNSQVWINGYYLGKRPYGYTTFQYDISDFITTGECENVIAVRVSREDLADSRWFTGSGITRKVSLLIYDTVFPLENGIFFTARNVDEEKAEIVVENEIASASAIDNMPIINRLYDTEGVCVFEVAQSVTLKANESTTVINVGVMESPWLWSSEHPYLYTLETVAGDSVIHRQKVGIRSIMFDPDNGFFINGKSEILKGVCVHHDGGCLGAAMTKEVWRRRLHKLKQMGCNAIRMSHNPHMPELYELCDELGFYVIDEAFDEWEAPKNKWHIGHNVYPPKHYG